MGLLGRSWVKTHVGLSTARHAVGTSQRPLRFVGKPMSNWLRGRLPLKGSGEPGGRAGVQADWQDWRLSGALEGEAGGWRWG